ncbi:hypothetical protein PZ61_0202900 [Streptomyces sp. MNU77]|nr:hypothetical protein PZ61_0202900 [Streptomyces sp. MNU77]
MERRPEGFEGQPFTRKDVLDRIPGLVPPFSLQPLGAKRRGGRRGYPFLLWAGDYGVKLRPGVCVIGGAMIILGLILLVIGLIAGIGVLWTIGIILVAIGALLWVLGAVGHAVGGRRHYW